MNQLVVEILVVAFGVVVHHELRQGMLEVALAEYDHHDLMARRTGRFPQLLPWACCP
jgi:hypothetical protein